MHRKPKFCHKPFEFFEVDRDGKAWLCCKDWLPQPIGDLSDASLDEVWNSPVAQDIRRSILDGSFRYCNARTCPDLVGDTLDAQDEVSPGHKELIRDQRVVMDRGPRFLNLGYDDTCNLSCPTCRTEIIALKGPQFERARLLQKKILEHAFADAESVIITGHGDAFGSRVFRELLQTLDASDYPNTRIDIMTNGLLLTPAMWDSLARAHPMIQSISVSIDAATPETYRINRGGDFAKLQANLELVARLRRLLKIRWYEISYVVQANNYREMAAFAALGHHLCCDKVLFQKLIDWSTLSPEAFEAAAVHDPRHAEHQAFLAALARVSTDPIVDLSNLADLVP